VAEMGDQAGSVTPGASEDILSTFVLWEQNLRRNLTGTFLCPSSLCSSVCLSVLLPVCLYFDCHHITRAPTVCRGRKVDSFYLRILFPTLFCSLGNVRACCTTQNHTILKYTALLYYTILHCRHIMEFESLGACGLLGTSGCCRTSKSIIATLILRHHLLHPCLRL
jgi:hypothetical protein